MKSYTIPQFLAVMEIKETMTNMSMAESLKSIAEVCKYILHPSKFLLLFWKWTFSLSYFICLAIALFGFFMIISGNKAGKKYLSGSLVSYFLINILNMLIVG